MSLDAGMEAIAVVNVDVFERKIEDIDKVSVGQPSVCLVLQQDIGEDAIVVVPYGGMKLFAPFADGTIVLVYRVGIEIRIYHFRIAVILQWIVEKDLAGERWQ